MLGATAFHPPTDFIWADYSSLEVTMVISQTSSQPKHRVQVAAVSEVEAAGVKVVHAEGHAIALFHHQGQIYACLLYTS
ncbi:hypothetical protein C8B47_28325, partial [filamentous cyanobacterium CCP4]